MPIPNPSTLIHAANLAGQRYAPKARQNVLYASDSRRSAQQFEGWSKEKGDKFDKASQRSREASGDFLNYAKRNLPFDNPTGRMLDDYDRMVGLAPIGMRIALDKAISPDPMISESDRERLVKSTDNSLSLDTALRSLKRGFPALYLNKVGALADLGYGSLDNALAEMEKADRYNQTIGSPLRNMPEEFEEDIFLFPTEGTSASVTSGGEAHIRLNLEDRNTGEDALNASMGYADNTKTNLKEVLGHELTHSLTSQGLDSNEDFNRYGFLDSKDYKQSVYPEMIPDEIAPPLAALTRYEFSKSGKRITTPEEYDKKVDSYLKMSEEKRKEFRSSLPVEVSRFYGYIDYLADESTKEDDLQFFGTKTKRGVETDGKVKGKDRLKRFNDINRRMIPGLVHQDGYRGQMDLAIMA